MRRLAFEVATLLLVVLFCALFAGLIWLIAITGSAVSAWLARMHWDVAIAIIVMSGAMIAVLVQVWLLARSFLREVLGWGR